MKLCHVVCERLLRRHGAIDISNGRSSLSGFEPTFSNATTGESAGFSLTFLNTTTVKGVVLFRRLQISMLTAGFEPATPASERPRTHALDRAATAIGGFVNCVTQAEAKRQIQPDIVTTGNSVRISTTAQSMKNELKLAVTICHLSI
jgi:hypothetical protein